MIKIEALSVDILGTIYKIVHKDYNDDPMFKAREIYAACDGYAKEITICNMHTYPGYEHDTDETLIPYHKIMLRHEIVHAFLFESGLAQNTASTDAWATNEEMVDWIARQGDKIHKVWSLLGLL